MFLYLPTEHQYLHYNQKSPERVKGIKRRKGATVQEILRRELKVSQHQVKSVSNLSGGEKLSFIVPPSISIVPQFFPFQLVPQPYLPYPYIGSALFFPRKSY